jgi:general secretion pathway protein C
MEMVSALKGLTVQALLHRYFPLVYLALIAVLGCVAGWLVTIILGLWLSSPMETATAGLSSVQQAEQKRPLSDYQIILDHNFFNPTGGKASTLSDSGAAAVHVSSQADEKGHQASTVSLKDFVLIGTIAAGRNSLALLRQGKETNVYRLGDEITAGVAIEEILRNTVILVFRDGSRQTLTIIESPAESSVAATPPRSTSSSSPPASENYSGIKQVGETSWVIPGEVVELARDNFAELLKQARMEPHIVEGKTDGFVVRMIRPRSFLDQLGLRRGDVVVAINDVQLDSPEKALQIFQQLREARDIKVDLVRNDQSLTLEYQTD